jgi:NADH-quinone oxidoreductase subunit H
MWAPIMAMAPALIVAAIIPFGPPLCWGELTAAHPACTQPIGLQIAHLDIGLLFYFAIASLSVYGATLAGWASHNKWSMMGGLRASSQMMSYEVTLGMAVLGAFLVYGTLEPGAIADQQTHVLNLAHYGASWGIFTQPLGFLLFLTAAIAETKRTPFDIPEGEPEIIGYFVEYSGLRFGLFFLGEFLEIVTSSAIMITLFFGGWHWGQTIDTALFQHLPNVLFVLAMFALWTVKVFAFCAFQLLIRWSLPRFRSDQLMRLGWQRLLPISIANVIATALVILWASAS